MSPTSVWRKPVEWGLYDQTYDFHVLDEAAVQEEEKDRNVPLPTNLFKPDYKNTSLNFKDIARRGAAPWATFSAETFYKLVNKCSCPVLGWKH